eukprot:4986685-Ditylum_brightwellii.AAC.1
MKCVTLCYITDTSVYQTLTAIVIKQNVELSGEVTESIHRNSDSSSGLYVTGVLEKKCRSV